MTAYNPSVQTVAWAWAVDTNADAPDVEKHPFSTTTWQWNASGSASRTINVSTQTVTWVWGTSSEDAERVVLLPGTGLTVKVYHRVTDELLAFVRYESVQFEDVLNDTGAGRVELDPTLIDDPSILEEDHVWRVEVEGQERFAFLAEQVVEKPVQEDERQTIEVGGRGIAARLEWAAVYPEEDGDKVRTFNSTYATVIQNLLIEAKARGTITEVQADGWGGVFDSEGVAWPEIVQLEFESGGTLLERLSEWTGMAYEWHMNTRFELALAVELGYDRSANVVLYPANTVREQTITRDFKAIRTVLMAEDANEGVGEIDDDAAVLEWGRREQYVVFDNAANEGSRTAAGYSLLEVVKDAPVERRIQIDPFVEGRKPFVDFGVGDYVSAVFGQESFQFRVMAIAMGVTADGTLEAEVTLDYVLEAVRKKRQGLLGSSGGAGGGSGGTTQLIAANDSGVADTSGTDFCELPMTAYRATFGVVGISLDGVASIAQILTVQLKYDSTVIKTYRHSVPSAGADSGGWTWAWMQIPEGDAILKVTVITSTGNYTIASDQIQLYVQANGIAGSPTGSNPNVVAGETIAFRPPADDTAIAEIVPYAGGAIVEVGEAVSYGSTTEAVSPDVLVLDIDGAASTDDGYTSPVPLFNTNGTIIVAGNQGGVAHSAWYRFPIDAALQP